jgi:phosphate transport system substrate-binding protein
MRPLPKPFAGAFLLIAALALSAARADTVTVGGSGAGLGVMRLLGAAFTAANPALRVEVVPSLGTAGGVRAVSEGALDIAVAGRELSATERKAPIRQIDFAKTAFVFVTSNRSVEGISSAEVEAIFGGTKASWNDGAHIRLVLRPRDDADFGYLIARFPSLGEVYTRLLKRPELTVAPTDQDNADVAETTAGSFATSTMLQIVSEKRKLRMLALDGAAPSVETIESGRYRLGRTYYLVIGPAPSAATRAFIAFTASVEGQRIVRAAGAVSLLQSAE